MVGIELSSLDETLTHVADEHALKPVHSFDAVGRMGDKVRKYMLGMYESLDVEKHASDLPHQAFRNLTQEELAKVIVSSTHLFPTKERDRHDEQPVQLVVRKIRNSMWKWGSSHGDWNQLVDTYDGIRSFDLAVPGFEVTLDCTTWLHGRGGSIHARVWLDGTFAFLVHWKGEHVMTIGFSVTDDRRLLIQQVQNVNRHGNRWMFRLPANRIEHIVSRFAAAFPLHTLHIADGAETADVYLEEYCKARETVEGRIADYRHRLATLKLCDEERRSLRKYLDENVEHECELTVKIGHLSEERRRLKDLYAGTGRFARGPAYKVNAIQHYALAA